MKLRGLPAALALAPASRHAAPMTSRSPLDDPEIAAWAWARFRRIMRMMMAVTVAVVIAACVVLYRHDGRVPVDRYIVAALVLGMVMLIAAGLMGLKFIAASLRRAPAAEDAPADDAPSSDGT